MAYELFNARENSFALLKVYMAEYYCPTFEIFTRQKRIIGYFCEWW
jgi:hypothetical protein